MTSTMSKGRILFDLSYADPDFQIPIIKTLVFLGEGEWCESENEKVFLIAGHSLAADGGIDIVSLNDSQIETLLDHSALADRLSKLPSQVSTVEKFFLENNT